MLLVKDAANATGHLDLRGLKCPLPAIKTAKRLRAMSPGAVLDVWADDPLAGLDIAHLCRSQGHDLLSHERDPDGLHRMRIRRGHGEDDAAAAKIADHDQR